MNRNRQRRAIVAMPLLAASLTLLYRLLARRVGNRRTWYVGFLFYWLFWCLLFPLHLLGTNRVRRLFSGARPDRRSWAIITLPPALALLQRFFQEKPQRSRQERAALMISALLNGTLEELLWRGLPLALFPDRPWWRAGWPTLWFALWHYAPGSVSPHTSTGGLMAGAGFLGAAYSVVVQQTGGIRWTALSHTLAGLAQVS